MSLGEYRNERKRESATGLSRLDGPWIGDCGRVRLLPGVIGDSRVIGWYVVAGVEAIMECILCANDMGDGCSSSVSGVGSEVPSGGVIRLVGIGETASSSSAAEDPDLDNVGDGLACSVVTLGPRASQLEGGNSSGPVVLVLACFQNRCKGAGDATLSAPSSSLDCACSLLTGESDRGCCGSGSVSGGITEGLVSGVLKDRKRCRSPTKRGVGVGVGRRSDDWSFSFEDIAGESSAQRKSDAVESRVYEVHAVIPLVRVSNEAGFPDCVMITWGHSILQPARNICAPCMSFLGHEVNADVFVEVLFSNSKIQWKLVGKETTNH